MEKGFSAADESTGTMTKRLEAVKVQSTAKNRLLFENTIQCIRYERMYWWSNFI